VLANLEAVTMYLSRLTVSVCILVSVAAGCAKKKACPDGAAPYQPFSTFLRHKSFERSHEAHGHRWVSEPGATLHGWWHILTYMDGCQIYVIEVCAENEKMALTMSGSQLRSRHLRAASAEEGHVVGVGTDAECTLGDVAAETW
jgi:hypothetical protein